MPSKVKPKKKAGAPKISQKKSLKPSADKKEVQARDHNPGTDRMTPVKPPTARPGTVRAPDGPSASAIAQPVRPRPVTRYQNNARREALHRMLITKRHEILKQIEGVIGQSLTEDQQRRLESAMDVGDQALMDLERELGISLLELQNKKRQAIDEALRRLADGTYGICADCEVEISEKRLAAVPFAKLCVECQTRQELLDRIEKEEERD
jgi:DnaK suppressor protein